MNAKVKGALNFVFCTNAFSQRNVTSIGLVIAFMVVYILAGGKVTTKLPRMSKKGQFGQPASSANRTPGLNRSSSDRQSKISSEELSGESIPDLSERESQKMLGEIPSKTKKERAAIRAKYGSLFTEEEVEEAQEEKVDKDGLVKGVEFTNHREKWMLER
jgi:hypothetical protein